jgi:hypothetical protein
MLSNLAQYLWVGLPFNFFFGHWEQYFRPQKVFNKVGKSGRKWEKLIYFYQPNTICVRTNQPDDTIFRRI